MVEEEEEMVTIHESVWGYLYAIIENCDSSAACAYAFARTTVDVDAVIWFPIRKVGRFGNGRGVALH